MRAGEALNRLTQFSRFRRCSGVVQVALRKVVQEVFKEVFRSVRAGSGAVQAPEPPLNTPAPCVRFGAGSAVPLLVLQKYSFNI